jgi:hypothetical protein
MLHGLGRGLFRPEVSRGFSPVGRYILGFMAGTAAIEVVLD